VPFALPPLRRLLGLDPAARSGTLARRWLDLTVTQPPSDALATQRSAAFDAILKLAAEQPAALPALLAITPRLGAAELDQLGTFRPAALHALTSAALQSADPAHIAAGLGFIERFALTGHAERLVDLLNNIDHADRAERLLTSLVTTTLAAPTPTGEGDAELIDQRRTALARAILRAVRTLGQHRRQAPVAALIELAAANAEPARRLARADWLDAPDHPAWLALRRRLRHDQAPAAIIAAWTWLGLAPLSAAATDRLLAGLDPAPATPNDRSAAEAVLSAAHRLLDPVRARALARAPRSAGDGAPLARILPGESTLAHLSTTARQGYARLAGLLPGTVREADTALAPLLADPDPTVRYLAVRAALRRGGRPSCLLDLCFDAHPAVARSAALSALGRPSFTLVRDPIRERALAALARSRDPRIAGLAHAAPDPRAASRPQDRLALRRAGPGSLQPLLAALDVRCAIDQPERTEHAVRLLRDTRRAPEHAAALSRVLVELLPRPEAPSRRLAASLAAALGDTSDAEGFTTLSTALQSEDPRVQANALEAIVRRARRLPPGAQLIPTMQRLADRRDGEHHRLRANAARGLLLLAPTQPADADLGAKLLLGLLADRRPLARAAGLWLSERLAPRLAQWPDLIDAVASLAREVGGIDDPDITRVRTRAERTARRLIVELREDWSKRAAGVEAGGAREEAA
jgi:hypothetical protein